MQAPVMQNGGLGPYHMGSGQEYPMNPSPSYHTNPLPGQNGQMPPPPQQGPPQQGYPPNQQKFAQHGGPYYNPPASWYPPGMEQSYYPNNGAYPGQGYYPPGPSYHPTPYQQYMPGQPQPQMGGPGPATVQNAYPSYQGDGYARQHIGGQQGLPQPGPQPNGHDGMDHSHFGAPPPPGDGHYSHPQQPPLPSQYHQPDGSYPGPYPPHPPPQQQPYFPPGHPYAYGGGVGYNGPPQQQPYQYNNGYPSTLNHSASGPPQSRPPSKGLNPAAQGFTFRPSTGSRQPSAQPNVPNGDSRPSSAAVENPSDTPTYPSLTPRAPQPVLHAPSSAAHSDATVKPKEWTLPIVNASHVNGDTNGPSAGSGLGLSQMEPASTGSVPMVKQDSNSKSSGGTAPGMTASETSHAHQRVETPQLGSEKVDASVSTVKAPVMAPEPATEEKSVDSLSFTGPTVEGYISPETAQPELPPAREPSSRPVVASSSTAAAVIASRNASRRKVVINIATRRPAVDAVDGNAFLRSAIQDSHHYDYDEIISYPAPSATSRAKRSRPRKGKALVRMGYGSDTQMRIANRKWIFGELGVEDIPAIVILTPAKPAEVKEQEKVEEETAPAAVAPVSAPAPAPKAKPASWAALFGKPKLQAAANDNLSVGPSSVRVSPSKSTISLATETDAMTSDPTTPRSAAPPLPPPSTGASAAPAPRPAFNYAAAASAGKHLSPENDLVKLLTEGPKPRPKTSVVPVSVPRGLVNTGNMCFANTVSGLVDLTLVVQLTFVDSPSPRLLHTILRPHRRV